MEIDLKVPANLSEITLEQYQEFLKLQSNSNDDEFIAQKMVSIFCNITMVDVLKIRITSLDELIQHFTKLFNEKPKLQERFELGGIEYGFIPSLEKLSFGEYIDLETNLAKWEDYHIALSVLYRPITNKISNMHDIEEYNPSEQKQSLMKLAPLDVAIGATLFFWTLERELQKAILTYSRTQMKKMKNKTSQVGDNLGALGDGIIQSTLSQVETLLNSNRSQDSTFFNVSPISHTKSKKQK